VLLAAICDCDRRLSGRMKHELDGEPWSALGASLVPSWCLTVPRDAKGVAEVPPPKPLTLFVWPRRGWAPVVPIWWRRGESNPRPKVLRPRIYMHSSPFSLVLRQHDVRGAPQDQPVRS